MATGPRQEEKQDALGRAEAIGPAIAETLQLSAQAAAEEFNRRGLRAASGGQWHGMQVHRVRPRLGL